MFLIGHHYSRILKFLSSSHCYFEIAY